LLEEKSKY